MGDFFKWKPGIRSYFGTGHILFIVLGLLAAFVVSLLLRKTKRSTQDKLLKVIFFVLIGYEIVYWAWEIIVTKSVHLDSSLPLYFCSLVYYTLGFVVFSKKEGVRQACLGYLATMNLVAGLMGLIFNTHLYYYPIFSFVALRTLTYHILMCFVSIFIWVTGYYKPKITDTYMFIIPLLCLFPFALTANLVFNADYCFLMKGAGTPFEKISSVMPIPCYILLLHLTILVGVSVIFYIPTYVKFFVARHKARLDSAMDNAKSVKTTGIEPLGD